MELWGFTLQPPAGFKYMPLSRLEGIILLPILSAQNSHTDAHANCNTQMEISYLGDSDGRGSEDCQRRLHYVVTKTRKGTDGGM